MHVKLFSFQKKKCEIVHVKNFLGVIHPYKLKGIWERERLLLGYANPHCNERENFLFANSKQQKPRESFGNCYNSHQINRQTRVFRYWRWTYCTTLCENSRYIVKINVATLNPKPSLFFLKKYFECMYGKLYPRKTSGTNSFHFNFEV